jgi:hypothetical protein
MVEQKSDSDKSALIARGRLKEARKWFARRDWEVLPQGIRGQLVLRWVADHAWMAYPSDPEGAVRRHCGQLAPWLKEDGLTELVADTADSNKRWSHDQSAAVLEIGVRDSRALSFRFLGCDDDPNYEIRTAAKKEKAAGLTPLFRRRCRTESSRGALQMRMPGRYRRSLRPWPRAPACSACWSARFCRNPGQYHSAGAISDADADGSQRRNPRQPRQASPASRATRQARGIRRARGSHRRKPDDQRRDHSPRRRNPDGTQIARRRQSRSGIDDVAGDVAAI